MTDPFDDTWDKPPAPPPDLIHITNGSGIADPGDSAVVGWDEEQPLTPLDRIRNAVHTTKALQAMPPATPLINGLLDLDSLALIYGPSGGSKTFLAVDLTLHIATSSWWNRQEVHPGPVIYVAAEGARGLGARITAWQTHHGIYDIDRHHPIHWITMPVNLHDTAWAGAFTQFCAPLEPKLVVVDTLARCVAGADENSAKDMGVVIDNLDRVKRATGACVCGVHHSGKDTTAGARGSSALRAAVDTELEVAVADELVTVKVTKQKDHAEPQPWRLTRLQVADSCVLVPNRGQLSGELSRSHQHVLDTLHDITVPGGVSTTTWCDAATTVDTGESVARATFFRAIPVLLAAGTIENLGNDKQPRYTPKTPGQDPDDSF